MSETTVKTNRFLRPLFFLLIVRPVILFVLGLNVRNRERLPKQGPAILVANHNSHLDTMVLMTLFPLSRLKLLRPVAAADYFMSGAIMSWFSTQILGIIPIARRRESPDVDPMEGVYEALNQGSIVIFYPEGTRGEAEKMAKLKSGIAYLAQKFPTVPVVPCFLHGLGKALPKGEAILVPFFCDVFVGEAIRWNGEKESFLQELESRILAASEGVKIQAWE